jgi:hypothetical protein
VASFNKGAHLLQVIIPANRVDPRLFHPLLLHLLLEQPGRSNPVNSNIRLPDAKEVPSMQDILKDGCPGDVPPAFQELFSIEVTERLVSTFGQLPPSPSSPVPTSAAYADAMVKTVLRMFWTAHNTPSTKLVEASRKAAVFHFKPASIFRSGRIGTSSTQPSKSLRAGKQLWGAMHLMPPIPPRRQPQAT